MSRHDLTIAVTGLNATDNPGPGVAVLRSIRHEPRFTGQLIGLAYDTLDPGLYSEELGLAGSFLIPYPSQGVDALRERIRYVHSRFPIDVIIPTLDSELPSFIALEEELRALGIRMYLPTREQFELRSKVRLAELGQKAGIEVPASQVISDARELYTVHERVSYPFMLKGIFYGAHHVASLDEALGSFHATVAKWGVPVIAQKFHAGEEYDVVAVGDGLGGLTDKGKGWAGVAVNDPNLIEMTRKFMAATRWRGPCEVEVMRTLEGRYFLIEVNPRFPAWVYLAAGAGQNLPYATVQLAAGQAPAPLPDFKAGTMFVRISLDQIRSMSTFQELASTGELLAG
jgi:carbamoyl-phosphate synthase large subunit